VITGAPIISIFTMIVMGALLYFAMGAYYAHSLSAKDSIISILRARLENLDAQTQPLPLSTKRDEQLGAESGGPYLTQNRIRTPDRLLSSALGKSDLSAQQLIALCKERTSTEQKQIAEVYVGFSLEVTGTIFVMNVTSNEAVLSIRVDGGRVGLVHAQITRSDFIKKAAFLRENDAVNVIGVISSMSDLDVVLDDCEINSVERKRARRRT